MKLVLIKTMSNLDLAAELETEYSVYKMEIGK